MVFYALCVCRVEHSIVHPCCVESCWFHPVALAFLRAVGLQGLCRGFHLLSFVLVTLIVMLRAHSFASRLCG